MAGLAFFGTASPAALFVSTPTKFSFPVGIPNGHFHVLFLGLIGFPSGAAVGTRGRGWKYPRRRRKGWGGVGVDVDHLMLPPPKLIDANRC